MEIIFFTLGVFAVAFLASFILKKTVLQPKTINKNERCNTRGVVHRLGIILALLTVLIASESFTSKPEKDIKIDKIDPIEGPTVVVFKTPEDKTPPPPKDEPLPEPPPVPEKTIIKEVPKEVETKEIITLDEKDIQPIVNTNTKAPVLEKEKDDTPGLVEEPKEKPIDEDKVFQPYEVKNMADYPGGIDKLRKEVARKFSPRRIKESGKLTVRFVVLENGDVGEITIMKGIDGCDSCSEEAIRVLKNLRKKFIPAELNNGQKVKVSFMLPLELRTAE